MAAIQFYVSGIFGQLGDRFGINLGTDGLESDLCWGVMLNSQAVYSQFLTKHAGPYNYLIMDDIIDGVPTIRLIRRAVNAGIQIDAAVNQKDCIFRSPDQPVIKYNRVDPSSLPRTVELQYISFDRDFAVNTQYARNEGARVQQNILSSAIDFILSDDQARDMAYDLLWRIWMQQLSVTFEHPDLTLEPGDIVQMQTDNGVYVVQITTSLITKEPMNSSDFGRTNQLNANLLLTRRGATVPPGQVNQSSASSGTFVIVAGATVLGVGDPPVVDGEFTITAGATVAGVGDFGIQHSHAITISEGQSVSLIETKGTGHTKAINISQSEAVTRTGNKSKKNTINISSPETVTQLNNRAQNKTISISSSEAVTQTSTKGKAQAITISQAETVTQTRLKATGKTISVSQAEGVSVIKGRNPPGVSGAIGWWDASITSSITLGTGTDVTALADQSGSSNNLTVPGGGTHPAYSASGFNSSFPAIDFSGHNNNTLQNTNFALGTGNTLTIWFVGQDQSLFSQSNCRAMSYSGNVGVTDNDNNQSFYAGQVGTSIVMQLNRNGTVASKTFTSDNTPHRFIGTIDSSGVMTVYVDGVASTTATLNANFGSPGQFNLGQAPANVGNLEWHGMIAEAGISPNFTNSTNVATLDTYLKAKWGL